jgi:glycosyltransferase involved in cell wall biosynthesis
LLRQTFRDFRLVLVDDGSSDDTERVAREYARRDSRIAYVRFTERRGMVAAWRAAFEAASAGGVEYFAWGSDHDRWHPEWLRTLVGALDEDDDVVLAYPMTQWIDPAGRPLDKPARQFETVGIDDLRRRWRKVSWSDSLAAGDVVYGLMRAEAVRGAGIFREVLCPDRLLIAELTMRGQVRQVPEVLWFRRQFATGSVERQRQTLFAPGAARPSAMTPPWYMHARSLWATYGGSRSERLGVSRYAVAALVAEYSAAYAWRHYGKSSVQRGVLSMLGWPRWVYKRVKHVVLLGVYGVLVALRHLGVTPLVERLRARMAGRTRPWRGHV